MQQTGYVVNYLDQRLAPLDRSTLEIICIVVCRTLSSRYRSVDSDFIRDAVQEAACRFYEQGSLRSEINARTAYSWILTAATRELTHILRYEGRFVVLDEEEETSAISFCLHEMLLADSSGRPIGTRESLTDIMTCYALLECIPQDLAEAVRLHSEGYTAEEIAVHVGCTEAAAYKRIQRGRIELRQLWRDEESRVQRMLA